MFADFSMFIDTIRIVLQKERNGELFQKQMAPAFQLPANLTKPEIEKVHAAVLILLFPKNNSIFIPFIQRTIHPKDPHSGQISFPGGRFEKEDISFEKTALREASEEIGIVPQNIEIIGKLSSLYVPVSGYEIHPFIAYAQQSQEYILDKNEVENVIEVDLSHLMNPKNISHKSIQRFGTIIDVPFYNVSSIEIWGATAMIISELIHILD